MKIVGLMITRDDGWCLDFTVRVALQWVDQLLLVDHCATPLTREVIVNLLNDFGDRICINYETDPAWDEAAYRQRMLDMGRSLGGTHFAIIDGDEALTLNLHKTMRGYAHGLGTAECLALPLICLWRSLECYAVSGKFGNANTPVLFRDGHGVGHAVRSDGLQIHTRHPCGTHLLERSANGGVLHLQHVEWRRLLAKQRLYKMVERIRWGRSAEDINRTYDGTVNEVGLVLQGLPPNWMPLGEKRILLGRIPWQESECMRLWEQYGVGQFNGLTFYDGAK